MTKLKVINGQVRYLFKSGKDMVSSSMDENAANKIINKGKRKNSNKFKGYSICIDDLYYFETIDSVEKNRNKSNINKD